MAWNNYLFGRYGSHVDVMPDDVRWGLESLKVRDENELLSFVADLHHRGVKTHIVSPGEMGMRESVYGTFQPHREQVGKFAWHKLRSKNYTGRILLNREAFDRGSESLEEAAITWVHEGFHPRVMSGKWAGRYDSPEARLRHENVTWRRATLLLDKAGAQNRDTVYRSFYRTIIEEEENARQVMKARGIPIDESFMSRYGSDSVVKLKKQREKSSWYLRRQINTSAPYKVNDIEVAKLGDVLSVDTTSSNVHMHRRIPKTVSPSQIAMLKRNKKSIATLSKFMRLL